MKVSWIKAWTTKDGTIRYVTRRSGKRTIQNIEGFHPYFYMRTSDMEYTGPLFQSLTKGKLLNTERAAEGWLKITYDYSKFRPTDLRDVATPVPPYHIDARLGDVRPHVFYMMDNAVPVAKDYRILYIDIETDDSIGGVVPGRDAIVSFAWCNDKGESGFLLRGTERELLYDMLRLISQYDIVVGWNSKNFDWKVIKLRCAYHGIRYEWRQTIHLDYMQLFMRIHGRGSKAKGLSDFKLETVAQHFLKKGKRPRDRPIHVLYAEDRKELELYNLEDARLLYELEGVLDVINTQIMLCTEYCHTFVSSSSSPGILLDELMIKEGLEQDIYWPMRPKYEEENDEPDYVGGLVIEPVPGLYEDVEHLDYASDYARLIIAYNISPDTLTDEPTHHDICCPSGACFKSNMTGLVPKLEEKLLKRRDMIKGKMANLKEETLEYRVLNIHSINTKLLGNALYGIFGDPKGRYYNVEIAEAVTKSARWLIEQVVEFFGSRNWKVLYGDTDSCYIQLDHSVTKKLLKQFHVHISKLQSKQNARRGIVRLDYKATYKRMIFLKSERKHRGGTKKRYAGWQTRKGRRKVDKVQIVGLEAIRRDSIPLVKRRQKELLEQLLKFGKVDLAYWQEWIRQLKAFILHGELKIEDLTITKKVSKAADEYASVPVHVRVAEAMVEAGLTVWKGMRVAYVVTDSKGKLEAQHPTLLTEEPDRIYYWNRQLYPALRRILATAFPENDWKRFELKGKQQRAIRSSKKTLKLEDFL